MHQGPTSKKLFKDGDITSNNGAKVEEFSQKYCVDAKPVIEYLKHLEDLQTSSLIRENERKKKRCIESNKRYKDYDWPNVISSGKLSKLKVTELDKYLKYHGLSLIGRKADKITRITSHFYIDTQSRKDTPQCDSSETETSEESESDSDEDEVLGVVPNDVDLTEEDESEEDNVSDILHTRSRRARGNQPMRYNEAFVYY